ncbi:epsin-3 isoform X1 [Tachysurus fulvidraco]|uniref:epsin-3 isoform X1 n=1 Tax=Tachysurus fulvidraco TaxID=1234273 RepID=UPI000F4FF4E1|nr:epsin-3 isoform X1 [Tachysurus fulvidraco]XP_047663734.1 epsin-3 isoform X1 [Tachysurus fulvidraco]XP_047663735.1 epsin-3 isoform X1 [Tachysurus fulvidraco]XP_047663736.1 epsin-3 isoform X1 [Tachysurus fulvidraco]XP_047663738.1 epsin-3 isoform X1 [Tachysurus fulvidraco]
MSSSSLRRSVKNIVNNYTEAEIKVREATSNDPWGPSGSLMMEIAELTFNVVAFTEVMGIIWKRLNDHGKNWRHVYKALTLLDYLVKTGAERVTQQCKENIHAIQTLRDFQYIDRDGQDLGVNVREKAKQLVALLQDKDKLKHERSQAQATRERMARAGGMYSSMPPPYSGSRTSQPSIATTTGDTYGRPRTSPPSYNLSTPPPHLAPELEKARPQTSGEEELQLQLALAMSREESEKPHPPVDIDEQTQLQIAMSLSKEEAQKKPPPAVTLDMDEDTQLQIALSLSKEEHQQEERSRQGDESLLQKALEESKREMEAKAGGQSAILDLIDIFTPASEAPPSAKPWDPSGAAGPLRVDPWDSLDPSTSNRGPGSSWAAPSSLHSQPWDNQARAPDPWEAPQRATSPVHTWLSTAATAETKGSAVPVKGASSLPGSPTDGDLFDDAMDGGQVHINGRNVESPELFDLSRLGESLAEPNPRTCVTPEAFLGPAAASLVNLDSLIPPSSAPKNLNPFLTGVSAPSVTNPFQSEQARLTLNQMRPSSSTSAAPNSLQYSASLPLPASNQPLSLPSSFTQPSEEQLKALGNLPHSLHPLSSKSTQGQPDQSQNPFL